MRSSLAVSLAVLCLSTSLLHSPLAACERPLTACLAQHAAQLPYRFGEPAGAVGERAATRDWLALAPGPVMADALLAEKPYARQIDEAARAAGIDPALVHAVVFVESAYRADAISPRGAVGLMQVSPATASRYGIADPSAVGDNLRAGTRHLRRLLERYEDRLDLALAAYNAGEGAVSRYNNSIPPYAQTQHYVPTVIANYRAASRAALARLR